MSKLELLSSPANPLLKDVRRAVARGGLTEDGYLVAESFHLLNEALRSHCEVKAVLVSTEAEAALPKLNGVRVAVVAEKTFRTIAATDATQGVIALVKPPEWTAEELFRGQSLVVVVDGLQDPGNAGAIVRSAEAFGATGVLFTNGTVSPYNPKALRASAGSLFRVPLIHSLDAGQASALLHQNHLDVYATTAHAPTRLSGVDLTRQCAFVIGSEAHGVSAPLRPGAIELSIPTLGVESLNAAVAASVLLYEARRQRA